MLTQESRITHRPHGVVLCADCQQTSTPYWMICDYAYCEEVGTLQFEGYSAY